MASQPKQENGTSYGVTTTYVKHEHPAAEPILIGGFPVWLGARYDIGPETVKEMDLIVPLNGDMPRSYIGQMMHILNCPLVDRGGVPSNWKQIVEYVAETIRAGHKVLGYCMGGHGRTGTLGASLIAIMEPEVEDPIAAIRERHCEKSVETEEQAKAIFELKGVPMPAKYEEPPAKHWWKDDGYDNGGIRVLPADRPEIAEALRKADKDHLILGWQMPGGTKGIIVRIWVDSKPEHDIMSTLDKVVAHLDGLRKRKDRAEAGDLKALPAAPEDDATLGEIEFLPEDDFDIEGLSEDDKKKFLADQSYFDGIQ